jgi:hypothetical protein
MNKITLRWIFFIPLSIAMLFLSKFFINLTFFFISKPFVDAINLNKGFGGYLILGPLFVLFRDTIASGIAIYSGVYLAPKKKKAVFLFFLIVYLLSLILISFSLGLTFYKSSWVFEDYLRIIIEIIAHIIGFLIAGIQIWKEEK